MGGERRRQKSLRIGVHHANAVVWELVYRTRLSSKAAAAIFSSGESAGAGAAAAAARSCSGDGATIPRRSFSSFVLSTYTPSYPG
eukprot:31566-Pelagococcus_subviridis.AAC.27